MMKILKNKKGMTLFEVVISITMLGIIAVPLMMLFTSSVLLAHKNRDKVDLNYVADIVVEEVRRGVKDNEILPKYSSYDTGTKTFSDLSISLRDLVMQSKTDGTDKTTDEIGIVGPYSTSEQFCTFSYKVKYDFSTYDGTNYPNVYEFVIYILNDDRTVKKLKIPIWAGESIH